MNCFPFMKEIGGARCLLVGGGTVALRKAEKLRPFGVAIAVCAKDVDERLMPLADRIYREYDAHLLEGAAFAVAATDDRALNARVAADCRARGISVNCVDGMSYACSKAALMQATKNFAVSLATTGVTVNGIAPVWIWTPMMAQRPGDYMKQAAATIPMGRVSYAEDYLGMLFFLASAASSYVTGQTFLVDGGWSVSRVFSYQND